MVTYSDSIWAEARQRYEAGETAGQIAKTPGFPTKQAINRRAKREGWERNLELVPVGDGGTVLIPTDLDPRKRAALMVLADGGNYRDASRAAHVSEETFRLWRKDPNYLALVLAVESEFKLEMLRHVRKGAARDPKHAEWMLTHHPSIRGEFGDRHQTTNIGRIKIGHLIQRDPAHKIPHMIEQDDGTITQALMTDAIEPAVKVEPVAETQQIERQEPDVKPEQKVISTDTLEFQGRSAFDIQFRKERGLDDD